MTYATNTTNLRDPKPADPEALAKLEEVDAVCYCEAEACHPESDCRRTSPLTHTGAAGPVCADCVASYPDDVVERYLTPLTV